MKADDLEKLDDSSLADLIKRAQDLLDTRKKQRRADAIEAARAKLAEAGLTPEDLVAETRKPRAGKGPGKSDVLRAGQRYVNPDDQNQVWMSGKGRRPDWIKALQKKGRLPTPEKS